ncbi:MAG: FHA domain-containing protein [Alphaproteobacteria bacterium]|nr:FHA domain-containing protein [Alphaproteobacteria bacterium]
MRATVRLRLPDGSVDHLGPGDIIGRTWTAALRLDDPGVSEAHALVSLRGETLKLLALRGRFLVDGQPSVDVDLAPGQHLRISQETELVVEAVSLPDAVLALEGEGLPRQVLAGTCSLWCKPHPQLVAGNKPRADAVLWSDGDAWRLRSEGAVQVLSPDVPFTVAGHSFRAVAVPLAQAAQAWTRAADAIDEPLRIVAAYDTVHLHRAGRPPVVLSGQAAQLISELVAADGPMSWEALARELWRGPVDRHALRRKWDIALVRLRNRLRDADVRPDLVVSAGGQVELVLMEGDAVVDKT